MTLTQSTVSSGYTIIQWGNLDQHGCYHLKQDFVLSNTTVTSTTMQNIGNSKMRRMLLTRVGNKTYALSNSHCYP